MIFSTGRDSKNAQYIGLITYSEIKEDYPRSEFDFYSENNKLHGYYFTKNDTDKLVIFSHGIYDYADSLLVQQKYFLDHGYNVLSYDGSGCGKSEGKTNGFSQSLIDLSSLLDYVYSNEKLKNSKLYLFGFSWGGYAVTSVLNIHTKNIISVASLSGYNNAESLIYNKGYDMLGPVASIGSSALEIMQKIRFNNYLKYTAIDGIINSRINTFIAHSKNDKTVNYKDSISYAYSLLDEKENIKSVTNEIFDNKANNLHLYLQYTYESTMYQMDVKEKYNKLKNEDEKKAFCDTIDKKLFNELNLNLFDMILDFYNYSEK